LKSQKPQKALEYNEFLGKACLDHVTDLVKASEPSGLGHKGCDGSIYKDRIERYCLWGGRIFEALDFAPRFDATDVVVAWLVDDGNKKRTQQSQLFNDKMNFAAVESGINNNFDIRCSCLLLAS